MSEIVLIAHNLRSAHNVGSLLRTAEGLGVSQVILSGYTPYPLLANDDRLPHLAQKIDRQIAKTALGAEHSQKWSHVSDIGPTLGRFRGAGFWVAAIEQAPGATPLPDFQAPPKLVLLVGREVEGIEPEILADCDEVLEIPMFGTKESFNVVQAAAMGLYHVTFRAV
ncbi:MAG: TrmH family RNA methyltransferase [Candidatus Saccharibacteria bacterium]